MNGFERIRTALQRREPDRVPHFEFLVDKRVREALQPGVSLEDFYEWMDLDAIGLPDKIVAWGYELLSEEKRLYRDQCGAVIKFSTESGGIPQEPALHTEADFDNYVMPDPNEDWRYDTLRNTVKRFKGQRAIVCGVTDVFDIVKDNFIGTVQTYASMKRNPGFIQRVSHAVLEYQLAYMKNCVEIGADCFFVNGDYATREGPMISPGMADEFLIPNLKKMVDLAHSHGALIAKHSDGMLWPLFDQIVGTGVDAIHPIDPEAGMDMGEAKAQYGHRVCLMGNVDCGPLLTWGTQDEVRHETIECIRKGGKGGGLICMSSNTIHSGVKPDNYLTMVSTIQEYGTYPLETHMEGLVEAGAR